MPYNKNNSRPDSGIILFYLAGFLLLLAIAIAIWNPKLDDKAPEVVKEEVVELPPVDEIKVTESTPEQPDTCMEMPGDTKVIEMCDDEIGPDNKPINGGEVLGEIKPKLGSRPEPVF